DGVGRVSWFRRLTFYSLLAGLCPFIPIPFLDDRVLDWVRRRMLAEQLERWGRQPQPQQIRTLAGSDEGSLLRGCLSGCFLTPVVKVTIYLLRKVFKKILIILTLNESVERFSETFHLGYLMHSALSWDELDLAAPAGAKRSALEVRRAMLEALDRIDPRPVRQLVQRSLRGSRRLLLKASRILGRGVRNSAGEDGADGRAQGAAGAARRYNAEAAEASEHTLAEEESLLGSLVDRLATALGAQEGYLRSLQGVFREALDRLRSQPQEPPQVSGEESEAPER
ncbi:MAG: hypothetical protein SX243_19775, partial [Acidobacteriota bacterium]|nr:hypothetical protein [Acidobacteriota bacterium]